MNVNGNVRCFFFFTMLRKEEPVCIPSSEGPEGSEVPVCFIHISRLKSFKTKVDLLRLQVHVPYVGKKNRRHFSKGRSSSVRASKFDLFP